MAWGAPNRLVRKALGALLFKEKCGFADEETVEQNLRNHTFTDKLTAHTVIVRGKSGAEPSVGSMDMPIS